MKLTRRNFFLRSVVGGTAIASIPAILSACNNEDENINVKDYSILNKEDTIVFQGDSITDAGREKQNELANNARSFGYGYALMAASELLNCLPQKKFKIFNRGVSGNKVYQLAERWEKDCIELKPDLLSLMIGVNDYWHMRDGYYNGDIKVYKKDYTELIKQTKEKLPNVKLVICQPYAVTNTSAVDESWIEPMKEYQFVAKKIAQEFEAIWVPFQKVFDEAVKFAPATYWTADGVHPSMAGAQLMAEAWLKCVNKKNYIEY